MSDKDKELAQWVVAVSIAFTVIILFAWFIGTKALPYLDSL